MYLQQYYLLTMEIKNLGKHWIKLTTTFIYYLMTFASYPRERNFHFSKYLLHSCLSVIITVSLYIKSMYNNILQYFDFVVM